MLHWFIKHVDCALLQAEKERKVSVGKMVWKPSGAFVGREQQVAICVSEGQLGERSVDPEECG